MGRKVASLLERMRQAEQAKAAHIPDPSASIMAAQAMFADIVTRNMKGEIKAETSAAIAQAMPQFIADVRSTLLPEVMAEVRAMIAAMPVPERVIERVIERVEAEDDAEEEESPKAITVQRKDGLIASVKVGDKAYQVVRNKQGLIKEVRPSGM